MILVVQAVAASSAFAGNHSFDAPLSLTGGTGVSNADPVADPGPNHPSLTFRETCGDAVDPHGDVYVSSFGAAGNGSEGRIDIFNPAGQFLTEISNNEGPCDLAVDAAGTIYVKQAASAPQTVVRYTPSAFPPSSTVTYGAPTTIDSEGQPFGLAVNIATGNVFVSHGGHVNEYKSAAEGNLLITSEIGQGTLRGAHGVAVDASTGNIFVGSLAVGAGEVPTPAEPFVSVVYVFDSTGTLKGSIDGSDTPVGGFTSPFGILYTAVDEETGEVFVTDGLGAKRVYRFVPGPGSTYVYQEDPELEEHSYSSNAPFKIAVSNGVGSSNAGEVFVTSSSEPVAHLFAFTPEAETGAPIISGTTFSDVASNEAFLAAEINPHGLASHFHFEYVDDAAFQQDGFAKALSTSEEAIGDGNLAVPVSTSLSGLSPGTVYHFRVIASNCEEGQPPAQCFSEGERQEEGIGAEIPHLFATFPSPPVQPACPNQALRVGPSSSLPDCRAYELVSPAGVSGHQANAGSLGALSNAGGFGTELASANGESVVFETAGGPLPGTNGNGFNDRYQAIREPTGWHTEIQSPVGSQMEVPSPGGVSSEHGYSFWRTGGGKGTPDSGSLVLGAETEYVRRPDGSFALLGEGSLGTDPEARGLWISSNGGHVVFSSTVRLEGGALPTPSEGVYDRTADGVLHVASLLPGDATPSAGAQVSYQGVSADGSTVAFEVLEAGITTLYVRIDDTETVAVESGATTFAGLSADGSRLTYVKGGNAFSFDTTSHVTAAVGSGGASTVVNVSADGSHVYFVSPQVLGAAPGPVAGKENLYFWNAETSTVGFVANVTHIDVIGEPVSASAVNVNGLGLWTTAAVAPDQTSFAGPGNDSSRTSQDGRFLVFVSRADLTNYEAGGQPEVYRYDATTGELLCVSCDPSLAKATAGTQLQSISAQDLGASVNSFALIGNVTEDGRMVLFESSDPLVSKDSNGVQDVYEWEASGVGGCALDQGCISLISSGQGSQRSYLYGVAGGGRDVFFTTTDALVPRAEAGTSAVYDARINGGFAVSVQPPECQLEACQTSAEESPSGAPGSASIVDPGNVKPSKACKAGQRSVKQHGQARCVKKKSHPKGKGRHRQQRGQQEGSK